MIAEELFKAYPKAAEAITKYYNEIFLNTLNDGELSGEFKELAKTQMIDNQYVQQFIDMNPRGTFDAFDAHNVYIEVTVIVGEPVFFIYHINGEVNNMPPYSKRIDAEKAAIERAFEILNEKL